MTDPEIGARSGRLVRAGPGRAATGSLTDWQGTPTIHAPEALASNGLLLEPVLELIRAARGAPTPR